MPDEVLLDDKISSCLIISNVIIDKNRRGKGLSSQLLNSSISYIAADIPVILFCKNSLISFYEKFGFKSYLINNLPAGSNLMFKFSGDPKSIIINKIL